MRIVRVIAARCKGEVFTFCVVVVVVVARDNNTAMTILQPLAARKSKYDTAHTHIAGRPRTTISVWPKATRFRSLPSTRFTLNEKVVDSFSCGKIISQMLMVLARFLIGYLFFVWNLFRPFFISDSPACSLCYKSIHVCVCPIMSSAFLQFIFEDSAIPFVTHGAIEIQSAQFFF